MGTNSQISSSTETMTKILVMAIIGVIVLVVLGNLSGNLGFATDTQGFNDTNAVINNVSGGVLDFFGFAGTWFTLLGVVLLIIIAMAVVNVVASRRGGGGFSA